MPSAGMRTTATFTSKEKWRGGMASITRFLSDTAQTQGQCGQERGSASVGEEVSGVQPDAAQSPKTRIAPTSRKRLEDKIREMLKGARGCSLTTVITESSRRFFVAWMAYFRLTETKKVLEELDGWLRHKLRCILWRQWKRPYTRAMNLMKAGLKEERAFRSAFNQREAWWNSGASHMNQAFPKLYFDRLGLVSLIDMTRRLQCVQ